MAAPRKSVSSPLCVDCYAIVNMDSYRYHSLVVFNEADEMKNIYICNGCIDNVELDRCCKCGHHENHKSLEKIYQYYHKKFGYFYFDYDSASLFVKQNCYDMHICSDCFKQIMGKCESKFLKADSEIYEPCKEDACFGYPSCCGKHICCYECSDEWGCEHENHDDKLIKHDGKYICTSCLKKKIKFCHSTIPIIGFKITKTREEQCREEPYFEDPICCGNHFLCNKCFNKWGCEHKNHNAYMEKKDGGYICYDCSKSEKLKDTSQGKQEKDFEVPLSEDFQCDDECIERSCKVQEPEKDIILPRKSVSSGSCIQCGLSVNTDELSFDDDDIIFGKAESLNTYICTNCVEKNREPNRCCECGDHEKNVSLKIHTYYSDYDRTYICTQCNIKDREGKCSSKVYQRTNDGDIVPTHRCHKDAIFEDPPCCGKDVCCEMCEATFGCEHDNHQAYMETFNGHYVCRRCVQEFREQKPNATEAELGGFIAYNAGMKSLFESD